jgi:WXG100 family type VII secretion target
MAGGTGGVHVQHDALATQAQRLAQDKNELEAKLTQIKSQIQELISGGFVTESASKSFGEAQERWDTAARACVGELEVMAQYLGKASAAFKDVDQAFTVKL